MQAIHGSCLRRLERLHRRSVVCHGGVSVRQNARYLRRGERHDRRGDVNDGHSMRRLRGTRDAAPNCAQLGVGARHLRGRGHDHRFERGGVRERRCLHGMDLERRRRRWGNLQSTLRMQLLCEFGDLVHQRPRDLRGTCLVHRLRLHQPAPAPVIFGHGQSSCLQCMQNVCCREWP